MSADPVAAHPAAVARTVERVGASGDRARARDQLAVEAPLELRIGGAPAIVFMRTPGHDRELVAGYLFGEGLIAGADDLGPLSAPDPASLPRALAGNVLDLAPSPALAALPARSAYASSSCGACGKTSAADLAVAAAPVRSDLVVDRAVVAALPGRLRAGQDVFSATGGLHAAGLFSARGEPICVREDVGRHNAVDKLIGWAIGVMPPPLSDVVLCVSGRLGFEIAQKAVVAGIPVVTAVSAPSSLAVDVAERHRVTLCAFVRDGRFNIYSHPFRVAG